MLEDLKAPKLRLEPKLVTKWPRTKHYKLSFWHDKILMLIVPLEWFVDKVDCLGTEN